MPNADDPERFSITQDVADILKTLREMQLQWIADEIERRIRDGAIKKSSLEATSSRKNKRMEYDDVRGLTDMEQSMVVLRAVRNYILLPPRIWSEAREVLARAIGHNGEIRGDAIAIVPPGEVADSISVMTDQVMELLQASHTDLDPFLSQLSDAINPE